MQDAQGVIDATEAGTAGAPGLGGYSLKNLEKLATANGRAAAPLQDTVGKYEQYLVANPSAILSQSQLDEYHQAKGQLDALTPRTQQVQAELDARQGTIDQARQAHVAATARDNGARDTAARIGSGSARERQALVDDLASVATGSALSDQRTAKLQAAGLLDQDGNLSNVGASLLPQDKPAPRAPVPAGVEQPQPNEDPQRFWQRQQQAVLNEYPDVGQRGSPANQTFSRAFAMVGNDPRKAVLVARAVFGK